MDKTQNTSQQTDSKKSKAVVILAILVGLMAVVLVGLGYLYHKQNMEAQEMQMQLTAEKDSISKNLLVLMDDYKLLETDNDSLNRKLKLEEERAKTLYNELQTLRKVSYAKIKEYQRELGTLRAIMKDLIHDVDSLNTMNQMLIAENVKVKEEAATVKKTVKALEEKTEELHSTVAKGSIIKARDVVAMAVSRRGNEITRARRVEKIRVCFTLSENAIAKPGIRFAYIRILGPDDYILAKSETDLFDVEGEKIVYSARREVDYQNKDVEMCIYYDNNGELSAGVYKVSVYLDGYNVGYSEFTLR